MADVLYVLLDRWADWEYAYAAAAVNELGGDRFENKTVSDGQAPVSSIGGLKCLPDYDLDNVPEDHAALILIGGMSWRSDRAKKVMPLVERSLKNGRPVGAICDACRFLAQNGVLNSVKHTGNGLEELLSAGEMYRGASDFTERQAVSDNGVITANGTAALEFAREVCVALGMDKEQVEAWYRFHKYSYYPE